MDNLNDEERILAWKATWNPSFSGIAIVNEDFTFRSVNPQFCKLLGVTPGDLIGQKFQDITPPGVRELDERNAKMIIDGLIDFYFLPKKYQFSDDREVEVVLLVARVPPAEEGPFQFFVSRIMLDENGELMQAHQDLNFQSGQSYQTWTDMVLEFCQKYYRPLIAVGTVLGAAVATLWMKISGILTLVIR